MNVSRIDSQTVSVSSPHEIHGLLSGCVANRQSAVTVNADILQTYDYRSIPTAARIDLSRMAPVYVSQAEKIARLGPGARYSSLLAEAEKVGMTPEFEPVLGIDFTMSDWAHESLRMISTSRSGLDGVIRNVKAIAPRSSFQTGFDTTPANGGGYDLTKLFMTSSVLLGVPYEFSVPLRPIPESRSSAEYSFDDLEKAINAGVEIHRSGLAAAIDLSDNGLLQIIRGAEGKTSKGYLIRVRIECSQMAVDSSEKMVSEIANKHGGKSDSSDLSETKLISPEEVSDNAVILGIFVCDTPGVVGLVKRLSKGLSKSKTSLKFSIPDLSPNTCTMIPVAVGKDAASLTGQIGQLLSNTRIPLRGNRSWNPLLGDSDAFQRRELITSIKRYLDPSMILNPQVLMEAVQ